jgi:hypothetical protein
VQGLLLLWVELGVLGRLLVPVAAAAPLRLGEPRPRQVPAARRSTGRRHKTAALPGLP